jgi:cytochrome b subunit of formate dehydrogenase
MPEPTRQVTPPAAPAVARGYLRWDIHQRAQHALLLSSVIGLVLTGWPMRFPDLAASRALAWICGGPAGLGAVHRTLGVLLIAAALYHLGYLLRKWTTGQRRPTLLFTAADVVQGCQAMACSFGFRRQAPRYGRYNWQQKFDYWAAAFGTLLMAVTGLVLWFPGLATRCLPGWVVTLCTMLHDYEALLAALAVFLWHLYWVHLNPGSYPMNMVWLTGRLSEREMAQRHPLELEQLERNNGSRKPGRGGAP